MALTLSPSPWFTALDDSGDTISGALIYTYLAGTSTPQATYTDVDGAVANANPIVCDAAGRCVMYLLPTSYKLVYKTAADVTIRTQDNVSAVPATNVDLDITGTAGEVLAAGEVVYLSAGLGSKTAGKWYLADATDTYSSSEAKSVGFAVNAYAADETALIRIQGRVTDLSGLTAGTTYYISETAGAITSTAPANARAVLVADSTTSGVMSFWLSVQDASATSAGVVNLTTQTLGAGTKTVDALVVSGTTTQTGVATFTVPPVGAVKYARQTADVTKNANTTLADLTGMSFAVAASEVWAFEFIMFGKSAAAADYKFTLTGPATPTAISFGALSSEDAPAASAVVAGAFGDTIACGGAVGTIQTLRVNGLLRNGATAGTVQIQMAQLVSDASDTIIYAESYLIAHRVA